MTVEELDAVGEAMDQGAREQRDVSLMLQAEREMAERTRHRIEQAEYSCSVDGCSSDREHPESACDSCLAYWRLEAKLEELTAARERFEADDSLTVRAPRGDRYYRRAIDAAFWRRIEGRTLRDQMDRVQRLMRQRFNLTDAGRAALREAQAAEAAPSVTRGRRTASDMLFSALVELNRTQAALVRGERSAPTHTGPEAA